MSDLAYVAMADAIERESRHGTRIGGQFGPAFDRARNPEGFRAYVTLSRYRRPTITTRYNAFGRLCWFTLPQERIYQATMTELRAGRELHSGMIANVAGVSQGYATKVLQKLTLLRFITVTAVIRGRWGRIVATITKRRRQLFLHREESSIYGGMINLGPYPLIGGPDPDGLVSKLVALERSGGVTMVDDPFYGI